MAKKRKVSERRIRQILSVILAVLLIGSVSYLGVKYFNASKAATTADTIYVQPSQANWSQGDNVSVTVSEDSGSAPVSATQFTLNYNAAQLQFTGLSESGDFNFVGPQAPTCTPLASCATSPGTIRIMRGMTGTSTISGPHAIVTLNFKVLAASGTTGITLDQANSIIAGPDTVNILTGVGNGTYTISPALVQDAAFSLTSSSSSVTSGSTVVLTLHLASPTQKVYAVHAVVTFPANQVQYLSTNPATDPFPGEIQTTAGAGTLDLVRAVSGGSSGFSGSDGVVAVMNFKVTGTSGTIPFGIRRATGSLDSGAYDGNGKNLLGSVTGANLTISNPSSGGGGGSTGGGGSGGGSTGGGQTGSGSGGSTSGSGSSKTPVYSGSTSFKANGSGSVTLNGNSTQLQGSVQLSPLVDSQIVAQNPGDSIVKVQYYLGKKLAATKTSSPFSYTFNTKTLRNGTYTMTIKTYYKSGAVDTQTQSLVVKNPVNISYVMVHYGTGILGSIAGLLVVTFLLWRYVWPRFGSANLAYGVAGGYGGPGAGDAYDPYIAPAADVISPTSLSEETTEFTPATAEETKPLAMENPQTVTATPAPQPASAPARPAAAQPKPEVAKPAPAPQTPPATPPASGPSSPTPPPTTPPKQ